MTEVKLFETPEYNFKQSRFKHLPQVPIRGALVGGSGSGKTRALASLLLWQYRSTFERLFIWSPSIDIDATWLPVKKYVSDVLKVDTDKEQCFFSEWDPAALEKVINDQYRLVEYQKKAKHKRIFSICIVIDDFADRPDLMHNNQNVLSRLFFRGRHLGISTLISTQVYRSIASAIRANLQFLMVWRLRNRAQLEALLEDFSAVASRDWLLAAYREATDRPYGFWMINLVNSPDQMFWSGMSRRQVLDEQEADPLSAPAHSRR